MVTGALLWHQQRSNVPLPHDPAAQLMPVCYLINTRILHQEEVESLQSFGLTS